MKRAHIALIASSAFLIGGCGTEPEGPTENDRMVSACREKIADELKSPGTAEFGPMEISDESKYAGFTNQIVTWVDAQNGFGATVRVDAICSLNVNADGTIQAQVNQFDQRR